jgi:predicted murein hydrolase (TIGR00659 family)
MNELTAHPLFGLTLTAAIYFPCMLLYRKTRFPLLSPLPLTVAVICGILLLSGVSFEEYNVGGSYLSFLLTPVIVCLAVPLYERLPDVKRHAGAILVSLGVGSVTGVVSVWALCRVFGLPDLLLLSLAPKSVTTPIGIEVAEALGGLRAVAAAAIILSGSLGAMFGPELCRLLRIKHPIAQGLAIGAAAHGLGTARAMEVSKGIGTYSGLAIGVCGLITALAAPVLIRALALIW